MSSTTVSMFVDMSKYGDVYGHRTSDFYLENGSYLLSHKISMVLFIQPEHVEKVTSLRKELIGDDYQSMTQIIPFDILEHSQYFEKYFKKCSVDNIQREVDPLYIIITWIKFEVMRRAIEMNRFSTEHFNWCDFGIRHGLPNHTLELGSANLYHTSDSIRLLCLNPSSNVIIYGPKRFVFAAGYITGDTTHWNKFIPLFEKNIDRCLEAGWGELEEALIENVYIDDPTIFEFYYGYFVDVLSNYTCPTTNLEKIRYAYQHDNHNSNYFLYKYLCSDLDKFDPEFIYTLLFGAFLGCWYGLDGKHRNECDLIADKLLEMSKIHRYIEDRLTDQFKLWDDNFRHLQRPPGECMTVDKGHHIHISNRFCISDPKISINEQSSIQ